MIGWHWLDRLSCIACGSSVHKTKPKSKQPKPWWYDKGGAISLSGSKGRLRRRAKRSRAKSERGPAFRGLEIVVQKPIDSISPLAACLGGDERLDRGGARTAARPSSRASGAAKVEGGPTHQRSSPRRRVLRGGRFGRTPPKRPCKERAGGLCLCCAPAGPLGGRTSRSRSCAKGPNLKRSRRSRERAARRSPQRLTPSSQSSSSQSPRSGLMMARSIQCDVWL